MSSPLPFILLFYIYGQILYVHYPPRALHGKVCFENNTQNTVSESCNYMKIITINNNSAAYSYKMNDGENNSNFFKILFYYSIYDTNWIEKVEKSSTTNCSQIKNEADVKCLISFILNIMILISLMIVVFLIISIINIKYNIIVVSSNKCLR